MPRPSYVESSLYDTLLEADSRNRAERDIQALGWQDQLDEALAGLRRTYETFKPQPIIVSERPDLTAIRAQQQATMPQPVAMPEGPPKIPELPAFRAEDFTHDPATGQSSYTPPPQAEPASYGTAGDTPSAPQATGPAPQAGGDLRAYARSVAQRYGVDPDIFERQITQESQWNPRAVSPAGAKGLGQFMDQTGARYGLTDPFDPYASLDAAARHMADNLRANGGDYARALAAYNAGQGAVNEYGGVPPYPETQNYVRIILGSGRATPNAAGSVPPAPPTPAPAAGGQITVRHRGTGMITTMDRTSWDRDVTNKDAFEEVAPVARNAAPAAPIPGAALVPGGGNAAPSPGTSTLRTSDIGQADTGAPTMMRESLQAGTPLAAQQAGDFLPGDGGTTPEPPAVYPERSEWDPRQYDEGPRESGYRLPYQVVGASTADGQTWGEPEPADAIAVEPPGARTMEVSPRQPVAAGGPEFVEQGMPARFLDLSIPSPPGWQAIVNGTGAVVDWVRERVQGLTDPSTAGASIAASDDVTPPPGSPYTPGQAASMEPRADRFQTTEPTVTRQAVETATAPAARVFGETIQQAREDEDRFFTENAPTIAEFGRETGVPLEQIHRGLRIARDVALATPEAAAETINAALEPLGFGRSRIGITVPVFGPLGLADLAIGIVPGRAGKVLNAVTAPGFAAPAGMGARTAYGTGAAGAIERGTGAAVSAAGQGLRAGAEAVSNAAETAGRIYREGRETARALNAQPEAGAPAYGTVGVVPDVSRAAPEPEPAPTFFSQLRRTLEEKMPNRASAPQIQGILRGSPVKPDEIAWTGLDDFLRESGGRPITKQQMLDFLDQNAVRVEEVVKGKVVNPTRVAELEQHLADTRSRIQFADTVQEGERVATVGSAPSRGGYSFSTGAVYEATRTRNGSLVWKKVGTFGGERSGRSDRFVQELKAQAEYPWRDNVRHNDPVGGGGADSAALAEVARLEAALQRAQTGTGTPTKYGQYTLPGGENYRELLLTLPERGQNPNMLAEVQAARTRLQEIQQRLMAGEWNNGDLLAERTALEDTIGRVSADELAGRWRSNNYRSAHWDEPNILAHVRFNDRVAADGKKTLLIEEVQSDWHQAGRKKGYSGAEQITELPPGYTVKEVAGRYSVRTPDDQPVVYGMDGLSRTPEEATRQALATLNQRQTANAVPDAPFKKTWPELAIKRMIRWAAENGYDRIAWPPGQVHAERYSLAQHVDELVYTTRDGAVGELIGRKGGRDVIVQENVPANRLNEYVGQDVANRMLSAEPDITARGDQYYLAGRDLATMGGEGMKGFYDQILPTTAQKIGKKFGATVGQSEIDTAGSRQTVHSLDITPAMRASVMSEGQPLFASAGVSPSASSGILNQVSRDVGSALGSSTFGAAAGAALPADTDEERAQNALRGAGIGLVAGPAASRLIRRGPGALATPGVGANLPVGVQQAVSASQRRAARMAAQGIQPLNPLQWTGEAIKNVGYSSMIGPATATVNVLGNLLEPLWAVPKELTRSVVRGNPREFAEMTFGAFHGLKAAGGEMLDAIKARGRYASNPDQPHLSERTINPIGHAFAVTTEAGGRLFSGVPDALFGSIARGAGEARRAAQIATDEGLKGDAWKRRVITLLGEVEQHRAGQLTVFPGEVDDIVQSGQAYADRQTFRDKLGTWGKGASKWAGRDVPVIGNFLTPFFTTPWNMNVALAERTPIGAVMNRQKGFDKVYDAAVGSTLLAGLVFGPAASGQITGSGPDDAEKRKMLQAEGWKPYHTLVGDTYVPNRTFGIYGRLLNVVGDAHDYLAYQKKDANARDLLTDAGKRVGRLIKEEPYLQGLADILDMFDSAGSGMEYVAGSNLARMIPYAATARTVGTALDPSERAPERGREVPLQEGVIQRAEQNLGLRSGLPVAQDVLGRPQENQQQGLWSVLPRMSPQKAEPTIAAFREANVDIGGPKEKLTLDGIDVPLTPAEQRKWQSYRGEILVRFAPGMRDKGWWSRPEARETAMRDILRQANETADQRVMRDIGAEAIRRRVRQGVDKKRAG